MFFSSDGVAGLKVVGIFLGGGGLKVRPSCIMGGVVHLISSHTRGKKIALILTTFFFFFFFFSKILLL